MRIQSWAHALAMPQVSNNNDDDWLALLHDGLITNYATVHIPIYRDDDQTQGPTQPPAPSSEAVEPAPEPMAVGAWAIEPAPEPHPSSEEGEPHPVWQELLQDGVMVEQESEAIPLDRLVTAPSSVESQDRSEVIAKMANWVAAGAPTASDVFVEPTTTPTKPNLVEPPSWLGSDFQIGSVITCLEFQVPVAEPGTKWVPFGSQGSYKLVVDFQGIAVSSTATTAAPSTASSRAPSRSPKKASPIKAAAPAAPMSKEGGVKRSAPTTKEERSSNVSPPRRLRRAQTF